MHRRRLALAMANYVRVLTRGPSRAKELCLEHMKELPNYPGLSELELTFLIGELKTKVNHKNRPYVSL